MDYHLAVRLTVASLTPFTIDLLREAWALASRLACRVEFDFNGRLIQISPQDDPEQAYAYFLRRWSDLATPRRHTE